MGIFYFNYCSVVLTCLLGSVLPKTDTRSFIINVGDEISPMKHFWESTGLCPPQPHQNASQYLLSEDMLQNIMLIGSVPHSGVKQVRIHWLLDMVTYDNKNSKYNFSDLDLLLQRLDMYGLQPGFELMGNPSDRFKDFDLDDDVNEWMKLVATLGQRYVHMFGIEKVSKWNFETWNEPDHKDFDDVVMSVEGFLRYYDACSEGLKLVDKRLVFGGPGGSCRNKKFSQRCWALLPHCVSGKNFITGKNGSRLDYISMHKKGGGKSEYILKTEMETISEMHSLYPSLLNTPIYNDEGDPMVGWGKPYWWRADATYPAIVSKIIAQHQYKMIANRSDPSTYSLLSNDNGFLSYSPNYFTQRTLMARFQMNNTSPHHVHLVRKPIHTVMGLFSKLGDIQLGVLSSNTTDDRVGTIASICKSDVCASKEISILTYASDDTETTTGTFDVFLSLHNISSANDHGPAMMMRCDVSNAIGNPQKVWTDAKSPVFPTPSLFAAMHEASKPACTAPTQVDLGLGLLDLNMKLELPGVTLHQVCWKPPSKPNAPILRSVHNITSGQVLITWGDASIATKCIKSYEIQICYDAECTKVKMVNQYQVLFNSFVFISEDRNVLGYYRVRAVDFWNRFSQYSNPLKYPSR